MNKKELITRVQRYMGPGATRNTASAAVEAVLMSILALTEQGEKLHLTRFGSFELKERAARRIYDMATGQMTEIPARTRLTFTPSRGFPQRNI